MYLCTYTTARALGNLNCMWKPPYPVVRFFCDNKKPTYRFSTTRFFLQYTGNSIHTLSYEVCLSLTFLGQISASWGLFLDSFSSSSIHGKESIEPHTRLKQESPSHLPWVSLDISNQSQVFKVENHQITCHGIILHCKEKGEWDVETLRLVIIVVVTILCTAIATISLPLQPNHRSCAKFWTREVTCRKNLRIANRKLAIQIHRAPPVPFPPQSSPSHPPVVPPSRPT